MVIRITAITILIFGSFGNYSWSAVVGTSNLANFSNSNSAIGGSPTNQRRAEAFFTGTTTSLLADASLSIAGKSGTVTGFAVAVHSDSGGEPGPLMATLSGSAPSGGGIWTYTDELATRLNPSTRYWLIASATIGLIFWESTQNFTESSSAGWAIDNRAHTSNNAGPWTFTTSIAFKLRINAVESAELPGVSGDYNNNGTVDAADYVLWRNGGNLQNDATPGAQPGDYDIWRANFGKTVGGGSALAVVPEPSTLLLTIAALATLSTQRHKPVSHNRV